MFPSFQHAVLDSASIPTCLVHPHAFSILCSKHFIKHICAQKIFAPTCHSPTFSPSSDSLLSILCKTWLFGDQTCIYLCVACQGHLIRHVAVGQNPVALQHQNRWYMGVHPPQNGGIGYDPWPCVNIRILVSRRTLQETKTFGTRTFVHVQHCSARLHRIPRPVLL